MNSPTKQTRRTRTAAQTRTAARTRTAAPPKTETKTETTSTVQAQEHDRHPGDHTTTAPLGRVVDAAGKAVTLPVNAAQRILPAKGGLPLYAGLGALGVAGVLDWPVAAGIGIGYAVLRRGALKPPSSATPPTAASKDTG